MNYNFTFQLYVGLCTKSTVNFINSEFYDIYQRRERLHENLPGQINTTPRGLYGELLHITIIMIFIIISLIWKEYYMQSTSLYYMQCVVGWFYMEYITSSPTIAHIIVIPKILLIKMYEIPYFFHFSNSRGYILKWPLFEIEYDNQCFTTIYL